jgi:hypothetical protein
MNKWKIGNTWGYYLSNIFVYSILYYILNMLDYVTTTLTLEQYHHVRLLNPLYYYPFFALLKPVIPVFVISLYFILYFITKSERDRAMLGKYVMGCLMALVVVYELICLNNIVVVYLAH